VIDLWSQGVIGWSMSSRMTAHVACDALVAGSLPVLLFPSPHGPAA
ncbi:transposase family protein, partial [Salmonella enterica subsp. salamae]|nr:transposase family protein [Salmonella enterica subsp. salamae]